MRLCVSAFLWGILLSISAPVANWAADLPHSPKCLALAVSRLPDDSQLVWEPWDLVKFVREPSVVLGDWVYLPHAWGPQREVVRRKGFPWRSHYAIAQNALQGDVRTLIFFSQSREVAAFMGLEVLDSERALIPSVERFNRAIDELSQSSPGITQMRLKSVRGRISDEDFLKIFSQEGAIPIAQDSAVMLHDVSFHAPAVFLPQEELTLARNQVAAVLSFWDWALPRAPESTQSLWVRYKEKFLEIYGARVDAGTGNASLDLAQGKPVGAFQSAYKEMTDSGKAPWPALKAELEMAFESPDNPGRLLMQQFEKEVVSQHPEWNQGLRSDPFDYSRRVRLQRARLQEAVRSYQSRIAQPEPHR